MQNDLGSLILLFIFVFFIIYFLIQNWPYLIRKLENVLENGWYSFLIKPFFLVLPSATLACYKIDSLQKYNIYQLD